jgi:hypothetical protein
MGYYFFGLLHILDQTLQRLHNFAGVMRTIVVPLAAHAQSSICRKHISGNQSTFILLCCVSYEFRLGYEQFLLHEQPVACAKQSLNVCSPSLHV